MNQKLLSTLAGLLLITGCKSGKLVEDLATSNTQLGSELSAVQSSVTNGERELASLLADIQRLQSENNALASANASFDQEIAQLRTKRDSLLKSKSNLQP